MKLAFYSGASSSAAILTSAAGLEGFYLEVTKLLAELHTFNAIHKASVGSRR